MKRYGIPALVLAAAALGYCVLSLYQTTSAAQPTTRDSFANSTELRVEMINELKEVNAQLRQQNALLKEQMTLLKSGEVKVVVTLPEAAK